MKQLKINDLPKFEYEDDYGYLESAWIGHRYFIYDLISDLKPKTVVELGTHHGGSFFSMAQAVKDFKLTTKLYAVDTWQGDKHAGFYDDKVYLKVKKIKKDIYKNVDISLLKKTFDEAAGDFRKSSIDILHIDGLHTYEAVKHDFDTWLPKVKKDGIILFHDVFEKQKDFGVWKLWEELKKEYDYFEFLNFHGLGLIFKGKRTFSFDEIYQKYYPLLHELNKIVMGIDKYNSFNFEGGYLSLGKQFSTFANHIQELETHSSNIESKVNYLKNSNDDLEKRNDDLEKRNDELMIVAMLAEKNYELEKEEINLIKENNFLQNQLESLLNSKFYNVWQKFTQLKRIFS